MRRKKNTAVYIDGENVSARKSNIIFEKLGCCGELDYVKVYGRANDRRTKRWSLVALKNYLMEDIRLSGKPRKNKIDYQIIADIKKDMYLHRNVDIFAIVSADHEYSQVIKELREQGKRVIVLGGEKTSQALVDSCNQFICI